MDPKKIIASAGKNFHTINLVAKEVNGNVETREAEPYSYRHAGGKEYFYCYDIGTKETRRFLVSNIISVRETHNSFKPRRPVEV